MASKKERERRHRLAGQEADRRLLLSGRWIFRPQPTFDIVVQAIVDSYFVQSKWFIPYRLLRPWWILTTGSEP